MRFIELYEVTGDTIGAIETTNATINYIDSFNHVVEAIQNSLWVIATVFALFLIFISVFSIRRKTSRFSESQVKELKRNGKYIPGVFVELNNSKEILRYFINGKRWKRRIINQYNSIYDNHYGEILKEANTDNAVSFHLRRFAALSEIEDVITTAYKYHENFGRRSIKFKDGFSESLPLFEITQRPYLEALGTLLSYVKAANRNYIVITGSAGNGKTNLLCSITELAIRLKESVVFLNSKNIRGSVDDYILSQLNIHKFWKKHKSVYFRILNTILRIKRKHLMVVIDAVNENDDPDYRERLHDFINMIAAYSRFKLIISCRNEYFEERFAKSLTKDLKSTFFLFDLKSVTYPLSAKERILSKYRSHFHYSGYISDNVKHVLYEQLLLLRIFFEVNRNSSKEILTIRKHELFEEYISYVKNNGFPNIERILDCTVDAMITTNSFDQIGIDSLIKMGVGHEDLEKAFDETILINKKLPRFENTIAKSNYEVLYFVFDELRDYYIARRIIQRNTDLKESKIDGTRVLSTINTLRSLQASCEEGVIQYAYTFFRTVSCITDVERANLCLEVLSLYREDTTRKPQIHLHHREEFMNYGIRLVFKTDLPLAAFEKCFIRECIKKMPKEDGGKLFDTLFYGTLTGMENDLEEYLDILFGFDNIEDILEVFKQMVCYSDYLGIDMPLDLVNYHRELVSKPDGAKKAYQIQEIAELFLLLFSLRDHVKDHDLRRYFELLPDHEQVKQQIQNRLNEAIRNEM